MPQSHLSTSSPWLGHTLIRHMPGFLDLINCLAHNPTRPQALLVFQWRDRAHFVVFVRYFGINRRKKTFFIFILFVWILFKLLSSRAPAEDGNGNKKHIMNWLSLIQWSLLMDIFWALVGKRDYGQRCQEASSWKSVRFEIPAGLLQVPGDQGQWRVGRRVFTHFPLSAQQQPQGGIWNSRRAASVPTEPGRLAQEWCVFSSLVLMASRHTVPAGLCWVEVHAWISWVW